MKATEDIYDEIEALQSIYAGEGEFELLQKGDGVSTDTVLRLRVRPGGEDAQVMLTLTLTLRPPYPAITPLVSLSSPQLTRTQAALLKNRLLCHCASLISTPMVMELVACGQAAFHELITENEKPAAAAAAPNRQTGESEDAALVTCLLRLDHMRARMRYVKTVQHWAGQLGLTGRLIFYTEKLILILLQGLMTDIKEYCLRQRTVAVDVDSKGRSCKERMATILTQQPLQKHLRSTTFQVTECQTIEQLLQIFKDLSLVELYENQVYPLMKR